MKICYLLLANGFEEIEALCPVDILRRAGCEVKTIAVGENPVVGSHGIAVTADMTAADLPDAPAFDALVFPGGMPGATNLDAAPVTDRLLAAAKENGAVLAAICAAPLVLGRRGLLRGKRATCYPGFEGELAGATVVPDARVVVDGTVITAAAMGAAEAFALSLVEVLTDTATAQKIYDSIHPRTPKKQG